MTCRFDRRSTYFVRKALAADSVYRPDYAARLREHRLATPHDRGGFPRGSSDRRAIPDSVPAALSAVAAGAALSPDPAVPLAAGSGDRIDWWAVLLWVGLFVASVSVLFLFFEFAFKPLLSLLIDFGDWAGITAPH